MRIKHKALYNIKLIDIHKQRRLRLKTSKFIKKARIITK